MQLQTEYLIHKKNTEKLRAIPSLVISCTIVPLTLFYYDFSARFWTSMFSAASVRGARHEFSCTFNRYILFSLKTTLLFLSDSYLFFSLFVLSTFLFHKGGKTSHAFLNLLELYIFRTTTDSYFLNLLLQNVIQNLKVVT